jgi:hypothetical protein
VTGSIKAQRELARCRRRSSLLPRHKPRKNRAVTSFCTLRVRIELERLPLPWHSDRPAKDCSCSSIGRPDGYPGGSSVIVCWNWSPFRLFWGICGRGMSSSPSVGWGSRNQKKLRDALPGPPQGRTSPAKRRVPRLGAPGRAGAEGGPRFSRPYACRAGEALSQSTPLLRSEPAAWAGTSPNAAESRSEEERCLRVRE